MTLPMPLRRALVIVGAASLLTGCITLFPKGPPAQLFRFGGDNGPVASAPVAGKRFSVFQPVLGFDRATAGDRILTVNGDEAAYIAGSRWVTSASALFTIAIAHHFDASSGPARLIERGELSHADYVLKLDVRTFEARYDHGADAAPTVVVELRAAMNKSNDRGIVGDKVFQAMVPASENRVSAIATAYDTAVGQVLDQLVAWVDTRGTT